MRRSTAITWAILATLIAGPVSIAQAGSRNSGNWSISRRGTEERGTRMDSPAFKESRPASRRAPVNTSSREFVCTKQLVQNRGQLGESGLSAQLEYNSCVSGYKDKRSGFLAILLRFLGL